ncbi:MAG: 3-dehydroquinate synthase [Weeksellaceae bacterium]|jgi:3-dehydroquinate synthase|nr:3-dehydroquinate synthase [Weeksellaceae bacterium]
MKQTPVYFDLIVLNQIIDENSYQPVFILVDSNTHKHCLPLILSELETTVGIEIIEIPNGEENKTIDIAEQIWSALSELEGNRKSILINLGGGVITDLGGFVASTFKRGIDFIHIPTTLLAMVDASIGGKTGVDLNAVKNSVGTFSFPIATFIQPEFLKTLSERELRSGWAEMMKHALIYSSNHWEDLKNERNNQSENYVELIKESVQIKTEIVNLDFKETGLRKILNFGHTVGHALESEFLQMQQPILHGEAVAAGLLVESFLGYENELINRKELDEIFLFVLSVFDKLPIPDEMIPRLINWMKHDKKNENQQIGFSLIDGIGHCKYNIYQTPEQITEAIRKYNQKIENL